MTLLRREQTTNKAKRWGAVVSLVLAVVSGVALAPPAEASFIGDYAPTYWRLINTNADGLAVPSEDWIWLILWGGNNGSGDPGTTDFVVTARRAGVVTFDWAYLSFDDPGYDWAGFLLGITFFRLADTDGMSGTESYPVDLGQTFGFRVETRDNQYDPGGFRIYNFNAPSSTAVPEPGTWPLLLALAAGIAMRQRFARVNRR